MTNNLIFGVAYYDEYMPYDRLDKDIQMMKDANINTIRIAESTWSVLESKEGVFNFNHIDRVIEATKQAGIDVIIGTPTYAVPSWLVNLDANVMLHDKNNHVKYGHRQKMDITNETYLKYAERVIRKLIEHTAPHENVIGFQLDNETKHYGTSGIEVQKKFIEYLKDKFVTTDNLNKAFGLNYWSNSIADWNDFPDIRGVQNGSLGCEFEKFQRTLATDFLMWQRSIVDEYKRPNQFVTQNFDYEWKSFGAEGHQDGYSYGLQPDACHYDMDNAITLTGTDVYHLSQDLLTGLEISFAGSEMFKLKDKQYLVLETEAQGFREFLPYPKQLRLQAWSNIANGACGIMYWNWHSIHNGIETYWKGLLSHDFESNPTYEEACLIGQEFSKYSNNFNGFKKNNKIAMLVDNESLTALKWFPIDKDLKYNDILLQWYKALYEINAQCDILYAKSCDFKTYDIIFAPLLYCADVSVIDALKKFVNNGGTLVSGFKSFVTDKNVKVYHERLPFMMTDVFGMTYNQITKPVNVTVNDTNAEYFMELINPIECETLYKYQHKVWNRYSAVTKNCFGNGLAYYIGFYPQLEFLKDMFSNILDEKNLNINKNIEYPVIIRNGINSNGKNICFVLNFSDDIQSIEVPIENASYEMFSNNKINPKQLINIQPWDLKIFIQD